MLSLEVVRKDAFNDPSVVQALSIMQFWKCCYCEKKIPESGHSRAVEHYRPKGLKEFKDLANAWNNLLHACVSCNGKKWKHFPTDDNGRPLIIDPTSEIDPEDHIDFNLENELDSFEFARAVPIEGSKMGKTTIDTVGLNEIGTHADRKQKYKDILAAFCDIVIAHDEITKRQSIRAFEHLLQANSEYAAFARSFARGRKLESHGVRIPSGADIVDEN